MEGESKGPGTGDDVCRMASINQFGAEEDHEQTAVLEDADANETLALIQQSSTATPRTASAFGRFFGTRERLWSAGVSSLVASIPALLIGYTIAFPSSALPVLMGGWAEGRLPGREYQFNTRLSDFFGALAPLGAIFGGPIGGWIADRWGRKCAMMFCGVPYLIGYMILSYAHFAPTAIAFKGVLLTGRFISGVGMGWASTAVSIYIGEISSARLRGVYGTVMQLYISVGVLVCYAIGSINYFNVALVAVGIITLFELLMVWLSETPRWNLSAGHVKKAYGTLKWLRGPKYDVKAELDIMKQALSDNDDTAVWREFRKKNVFVPFVILLLVFFFQQIGGLNAQGAYGAIIFKDAGVSNPYLASTTSIGISVVLGTVLSFFIVDLVGRKSLLVVSGIGMGIGSFLLGLHFYLTRPSLCSGSSTNSTIFLSQHIQSDSSSTGEACNAQYGPLAIVSIITYNFMFSAGWAPVPWILLPELLPLKVRGFGGGFAVLVNWATSALVTGTYLDYAKAVTPWFAWWSFALLNLTAVVFALLALVETKGKNLEDIQTAFEKRWKLKLLRR